jgi:hypothetical protein
MSTPKFSRVVRGSMPRVKYEERGLGSPGSPVLAYSDGRTKWAGGAGCWENYNTWNPFLEEGVCLDAHKSLARWYYVFQFMMGIHKGCFK